MRCRVSSTIIIEPFVSGSNEFCNISSRRFKTKGVYVLRSLKKITLVNIPSESATISPKSKSNVKIIRFSEIAFEIFLYLISDANQLHVDALHRDHFFGAIQRFLMRCPYLQEISFCFFYTEWTSSCTSQAAYSNDCLISSISRSG